MEKVKYQNMGLTTAEVEESRRQHGANVLTPPRRRSLWTLYLEKYEDPIVRILLVAALASLVLACFNGEFVETIGIILAVLFATTVGFYFERDAARKFDLLTQLGEEQQVKVVRDGVVTLVARRDVVVGDLVIVETGDEVPADGELTESNNLEVDESSLTGEPMARKQAADNHEKAGEAGTPAETTYPPTLLLRSSMVMSGTGRFRVSAVGDQTEIGRVARMATELTQVKTPLNLQLSRLAALISKVGTAISVLAFAAFLLHDILTNTLWSTHDYMGMVTVVLRYFMMAVTLIVMAVPEGLPMAVTLALALNMRRMLRSGNLVRKLQASETMGAVTVICTDKTGTLTENRMRVEEMVTDDPQQLARAIALNTTAYLHADGTGIGNPTEVALLRWLQQEGFDYEQLRREAVIDERLPFSTERKLMATRAGTRVYIKGAPEIVLALCGEATTLSGSPLSPATTPSEELLSLPSTRARLAEWQGHAMRTLAFAWKEATALSIDGGFTLQAVCAIADPVRQDVPEAVAGCLRAGIDVKVVTGDVAATAIEIARQIGITSPPSPLRSATSGDASLAKNSQLSTLNSQLSTVTGPEFAALSDDEAMAILPSLKVMSRARPADKQRLVELLRRSGEVVAVTGDGTNDAPALNHAHVGLSLGSGTSVAKEASDITVIDDSFRSVERAVEWGRSLYKNIQRFIFFQLVVNVTALLLVLGGSVIGTEMPLTVTQILWVNLIMDTFAAMALASLPPSHEVMDVPPRRADDFIITRAMLRGIVGIGLLFFAVTLAYLYWLEHNAVGEGVTTHELTRFFTFFVMLQWWNLFNARALGSRHSALHHFFWCRGFVFVLALILLGQWAIVEWGGEMFRTEHLSATEWLVIILGTMPVLVVGEAYRFTIRLWRIR